MTIGILALQGAVQDHERPFRRLGVETRQVRVVAELEGLSGLVLPGGESTVMSKYLKEYRLDLAIKAFADAGRPIWGLCAGAILLCTEVDSGSGGPGKPGALGLLPARATRNAYGRQLSSFEEEVETVVGHFPGIYIRAPRLEALSDAAGGEATEEIGWRRGAQDPHGRGEAVMLRRGKILAASFHPELSGDDRLHEYFLTLAR